MNFFRIIIGLLLITLLPTPAEARKDTLHILHLSDIHLIFNNDQFHPPLAANRRIYANGIDPFRNFMQTVPDETKADLVIINGDLVDFYDGMLPSGEMLAYQLEQFLDLVNEFSVPVSYVLGNHDIVSYGWKDNSRTSSQHVAGMARAAFIRNSPVMRNGTYYHQLFRVGGTQYRILYLDNAFNSFSAADGIVMPYLDYSQLRWLEYQLKNHPGDCAIVVMHIPMDIESETKPEVADVFKLLSSYSSVKLVLAGHQHINLIHSFETGFAQVQTGAFATDPTNWRKLMLTDGSILVSQPGHTHIEMVLPIR